MKLVPITEFAEEHDIPVDQFINWDITNIQELLTAIEKSEGRYSIINEGPNLIEYRYSDYIIVDDGGVECLEIDEETGTANIETGKKYLVVT